MKEKTGMPSSEEDQAQFVKDSALYKEFLAEREEILGVIRHRGLKQTLSENGKSEAARLTWDEAAGKVENILMEVGRAGVA